MPRSRSSSKLAVLIITLLLVSLACSLPGLRKSTPTPVPPLPTVTPTAALLPPALVESSPIDGSEIALDAPLTLTFNQPMDRTSVEGALVGAPPLAGKITWVSDRSLTFTPDVPFLPGTALTLTVNPGARSQRGLSMAQPAVLNFHTAGLLRLTQQLPAPDAADVSPDSAIVASFNQPVVPLGADPASLPPAFTLEPAAEGRSEWLNTSTYIFYPEPGLTGGLQYIVTPNPDLKSALGSQLEKSISWSFSVAMPRVLKAEPQENALPVRLDTPITLTFNQAMNPESVQANFLLSDMDGRQVPGRTSWNEDYTELTFVPDNLLQRSTFYTTQVNAEAQNAGGIPLGVSFSARWITVPVQSVSPLNVGPALKKPVWEAVQLLMSANLPEGDLSSYFTFQPALPNFSYFLYDTGLTVYLSGDFAAQTDYTLQVSPDLPDAWGAKLGQPYTIQFSTAALDPTLTFTTGSSAMFLTPRDRTLSAQASSISSVQSAIGTLPLADFITLIGPEGYSFQESYHPKDESVWTTPIEISPTSIQVVDLPVAPVGSLNPGLYFLRYNNKVSGFHGPFSLVVSNINLTIKIGTTEAFIWAVDLRTGKPVAGGSVTIYDSLGTVLASGLTGEDGVLQAPIPVQQDPYQTYFAVLERPGDDGFGLALSTWMEGISPGYSDINVEIRPPGLMTYLYTDRPIYKPGQTVYYRAVARQAYNAKYSLPDQPSLTVEIYDGMGAKLSTADLPLSVFGTVHGEYKIVEGAVPGYYRLQSGENAITFQVADYRKPEIDLKVSLASEQVQLGQNLSAQVSARYFFDAPAGNVALHWAVYKSPASFSLPGYQVGPEDNSWLEVMLLPTVAGGLGDLVSDGSGTTDPQGLFTLEVPTQPEAGKSPGLQTYTLEVTLQDESGLPVSARAAAKVHPAVFYVGLHPDIWVGQAGVQLGFDVFAAGWDQNSAGNHPLTAEFRKVKWIQQPAQQPGGFPTYVPEYTPISSADFTTGADGKARLSFVPPEPGTYQLQVSGEGALTQITLWVGGDGQAAWPQLPNQRLHLSADLDQPYRAGQAAQVFIPNPLGVEVPALITVERATVLSHQVMRLGAQGATVLVPINVQDAPTVYVSALLLGSNETGQPDFRLGFLKLNVEPALNLLNVELTSNPERAGPGEEVTFSVRVTDAEGNPVQGEFSLSVVDEAVLALTDPNALTINKAFYDEQPIGMYTSLDLAAYVNRSMFQVGGLGEGGGGEEMQPSLREDFPDTAYWNAEILTNANGEAAVKMNLPDSLTTWKIQVRGLTADTRVGESETQMVATKDLLVRPVLPRFLVAGDHALLAAVIQNNTSSDLQAEVSFQAAGFLLDESQGAANSASRKVSLLAGSRQRLEWWGTVQDVNGLEVTIFAQAGDLQDAVRIPALPVLRYTAPQAFSTSGLLEDAGERVELVSLPPGVEASRAGSGELKISLAPSLVAAASEALAALERSPYPSNEQTLSGFLPELEIYQAIQSFGVTAPELKARLDRSLPERLNAILARQNTDGGWSWWPGGESDPLISAYILFGLVQAQAAGISVPVEIPQHAVAYLVNSLPSVEMSAEGWQLDRLAFEHFALAQAGSGDLSGTQALYEARPRLSPWAQALLALTLDSLSPGSAQAQTLLSDLQANAIVSSTGAHWEDQNAGWRNMSSTVSTTAIVVYALALREPASPVLLQATRFLMASRQPQGTWASTYDSAWALLAAAEFVKGTGELGGSFDFSASLNGVSLVTGQAGGDARLTPVTATASATTLYPDDPNALVIQRSAGTGRLYYTALLDVDLPVESAQPVNRGLTVSRFYTSRSTPCTGCASLQNSGVNQQVLARVTLVVPQDAYYVLVEDYIPAGSEILDTSLQTSQLGAPDMLLEGYPLEPAAHPEPAQPEPTFAVQDPFAQGWGWWYFHQPQIYDDHIAWSADYLPAGTYVLDYVFTTLQPGEYRVLPARARQLYFPEVQGNSAGMIFTITP